MASELLAGRGRKHSLTFQEFTCFPSVTRRRSPSFRCSLRPTGLSAPSTHSGPVPPLPLSLPANVAAAPARGSRQSPDGSASHTYRKDRPQQQHRDDDPHSRPARGARRGTPRPGGDRRPHTGRVLGADRRPARGSSSLRTGPRMLGPSVAGRDRRPRKRTSTTHPHRPEPHRQARTWTGKH